MPFTRPTLSDIVERIQADVQSRITGATTFLRRSVLKVLGRVLAGAIHLLYGYLEYQKDQLFVSTADAENLETHGAEFGVTRNAATKATGSGIATGTVGISIPASTELQSSVGEKYITDALATIGAGGSIDINITAKNAGADGNEDGGASLTFVSPISGVNTIFTVSSSGLSGGADEETDSDYRTRILTRKRRPPHGGSHYDYENWALEVSGVTRAWTIEQYQGVGTIGLVFVRDDDDDLIPSEAEKTAVEAYIFSHTDTITGEIIGIPVTAEPGFYIIDVEKVSVNLSLSIYPNTTSVQTAIQSKIEDLILIQGGPGETIYESELSSAISSAAGEERHSIDSSSGLTASTSQVQVLGTITWGEHNG